MRIIHVIALLSLLSLPAIAAEYIDAVINRAPVLNPNNSAFPDSSLIDHSAELDAPAGKHGFVTARDGHFFFEDGRRARFYGVNLAKTTVFIEKEVIDRLCALFARSGINLVRIHHIDDAQGILNPQPDTYFDEARLDKVDYWIAKLKERGIYVCLDLNDYRTFRADEGVLDGEQLGRGAKPYAVFDEKLIALQQEYAQRLLVEHVNPYTKLSYAADPTVAMLEIYDENGLFIRRGDWPTLREPYRGELTRRWNEWLITRYGSTDALRVAWTNRTGACSLAENETLEQRTVRLPRLAMDIAIRLSFTDPLIAPARVSDGVQFAQDVQARYLKSMTEFLRNAGVKIPVTAVGAQDILPDLMATAENTDFIGINYYWDHPTWNAGKDWTLPSYFSLKNPVDNNLNYSFPAISSLARMHKKPLVVRELGYCYPNPYRGVGMLESAAYGAFLDLDALILFTFDAYAQARTIGYFDIHLDPLRWGLISQASRLFLSGEVEPSKFRAGIGYTPIDAYTWYQYQSPLYQLAFSTRLENYTTPAIPNPFDLLIASGRSVGGIWSGGRLLLSANNLHTDLHFQGTSLGMDVAHQFNIVTGSAGIFDASFHGVGFEEGVVKKLQSWPAYILKDLLANGLQPVATTQTAAIGFIDAKQKVIGFRNLAPDLALRVGLDALRDWNGAIISHRDIDGKCMRSDTRQIERDIASGLLRVDTPTFQMMAGVFKTPSTMKTSTLKLTTPTPVGTLTAESLDAQPLDTSQQYLIKMTSRARNDNTLISISTDGPKPQKLSSMGNAPIITGGEKSAAPTTVEIAGKMAIQLSLINGCWEYLREGKRGLLYLDTGDITVTLPERPKLVRWHTSEDAIDFKPQGATLTIPSGVRFTEFFW